MACVRLELQSRLGHLLPAPDDFRRSVCYTREVNGALRKHEGSLRAIFEGLAAAGRLAKHVSLEVCYGRLPPSPIFI